MSDHPYFDRFMAGLVPGRQVDDIVRDAADPRCDILEIGPGANAMFRKRDFAGLKISDYTDTAGLRASLVGHYGSEAIAADSVEEVDYVCADGDLAAVVPVGQQFDLIYSGHNIEHQPNLLLHLQSLQQLLRLDGVVMLSIPDRRCTFDVFRALTRTSDVLQAFHERRRAPTPQQLFDLHYLSVQGDFAKPRVLGRSDALALGDIDSAYAAYLERLSGNAVGFVDMHHSVFTPQSFQVVVRELYLLGLTELLPLSCSDSLGNSFLCMLGRAPRSQHAVVNQVMCADVRASVLEGYRRMQFERG